MGPPRSSDRAAPAACRRSLLLQPHYKAYPAALLGAAHLGASLWDPQIVVAALLRILVRSWFLTRFAGAIGLLLLLGLLLCVVIRPVRLGSKSKSNVASKSSSKSSSTTVPCCCCCGGLTAPGNAACCCCAAAACCCVTAACCCATAAACCCVTAACCCATAAACCCVTAAATCSEILSC